MSDTAIKVEEPSKSQTPRAFLGLDTFDIWLIVLVLASYLIVGSLPFKAKKFGDGVFFREAKTIAQALHGAKDWHEVAITQAPGPVAFYAIPYSLMPSTSTDDAYWLAGFIWTMGWICFSILLIRRAAVYLADEWSGKMAAIVTLLTPLCVYYSYGVWAESLAYIGAAIACFGWARSQAVASHAAWRKMRGSILFWSLGIVIIILARPNAILILAVGVIAVLKMLTRSETRRGAKLALVAITLAMVVSIGCLSLASLLSNGSQENTLARVLFHGRFQYRTEPWDWRFWGKEYRAGSADFEMFSGEEEALRVRAQQEGVPVDSLKRKWVVQDWLSHPGISLQQAGIRCLTLNLMVVNSKPPDAFRISIIPGRLVYVAFHIAVNLAYVIVLLGSAYFLMRQSRESSLLLDALGALRRLTRISLPSVCRASLSASRVAGIDRYGRRSACAYC